MFPKMDPVSALQHFTLEGQVPEWDKPPTLWEAMDNAAWSSMISHSDLQLLTGFPS